MKFIRVQEIHNDPKGYDYGVNFINNTSTSKNFAKYSQRLGRITQKQYDSKERYWKIYKKDLPYLLEIEQELGGEELTIDTDPSEGLESWMMMDPNISTKTEEPINGTKKEEPLMGNNLQQIYTQEELELIGKDMKLQPYPYQKELIKFCTDHSETLLICPCGSGKTPTIVGTILQLKKENKMNGPAMIIVKASLKYQFAKEIEKFSDLNVVVIQTLSQLKKNEEAFEAQFKDHDVYVLNYESLRDATIRKHMHKLRIQFMACDEIQYVKDDTTKRSKAVCEFAYVPYKVGATATPVQKNPMDIFSLFKFLKPELFPKKTAFGNQYVRWTTFGPYIRKPIGAKNEKELNQKIAPYIIVKTKEEISSQLPSLVVLQRTCSFPSEQQEVSNQLLEELNALHEQEKAISVRLAKAGAKTSDALKAIEGKIMAKQTFAQELANDENLLLGNEGSTKYYTGEGSAKTDMCMDLVHEIIESGEKVCIFSKYHRYQDILTQRLKKEFKDIKIAYVNGQLSAQKRYEEVYTKFTNNPDYKVLIMTSAGAEGINLSQCQYLIEMELADSYAEQIQRHGRIERADSTHKTVYVYQLLTENSYDDIAQKIVKKKEKYDSQIIHGNEL